jgi:2'-5' RNA ligase
MRYSMPLVTQPGTSLRLFVALTLPEEVRSRIDAAQLQLRRTLPADVVRWTKPEQFHLTLCFLGNVEAGRVEALTAALRLACAGFPPLDLKVARIGFFPRPAAPRVIWVGVSDQQNRLPLLHRAVQRATSNFTEEELEERFTGHITVGRIKGIRPNEAKALAEAARRTEPTVFGSWTATKVELIRSRLSPRGATHDTLAAAGLLPPGGG